jgi:hypothetical protein
MVSQRVRRALTGREKRTVTARKKTTAIPA